ncbi:MAG TPA: hypothetical protein VFM46_00570, partial [Pseudomonadales bacterium]|nr:hypothetical protein [Pseudomonadales bacterium]
MKLLALVLVLLLRPVWRIQGIGVERFFVKTAQAVGNLFPATSPTPVRLAAHVVLLPLLLAILFLLFDKTLYSLPSFILGLLILAEALLCRNLDKENAEWLKAWTNKEWQRAYELMAAKRKVPPLESVTQMQSLYLRVWGEVWLQQVFSTVFWFGLFGPEGAIL